MTAPAFQHWFEKQTGVQPRPWQARLATDPAIRSRLVRAPTGTGKTLGALGAWAYNRLCRQDDAWPRRLVFVLPMRVLVEQCAHEIATFLRALGCLAESPSELGEPMRVGVHVLMGGVDAAPWHLYPDRDAVLIGTQDMLLSRALNRGYAAPRARWPMEYGMLHHDALWVLDEVQLMGVGFATTAQLQAFRDALSLRALRPAHSWWMSATLQPNWLHETALHERVVALAEDAVRVPAEERVGGPFEAKKLLRSVRIPRADDAKHQAWASTVVSAHKEAAAGEHGRITLAVCNTVDDAIGLFEAVAKLLGKSTGTELKLVHSRFRGMERAAWREAFLSRAACSAGADRIIVATQVVEAGVDISATALVTQLAPWSSLVQRFGRAARYGGTSTVTVVDRQVDERTAAPYELGALNAALEALVRLKSAGLADIEELEADLQRSDAALLARLYPYEPLHVLTRREHEELFDTDPDLTGMDLDVSRFIREGDERDVLLWWYPSAQWRPRVAEGAEGPRLSPPPSLQPERDELCRVGVAKAKEFLLKKAAEDGAAWRWDYLEGAYRPLRARDGKAVYPGQTFLIDSAWGGYDTLLGFTGQKRGAKEPEIPVGPSRVVVSAEDAADLAQDADVLSKNAYRTIATHGAETAARMAALCDVLQLSTALSSVLVLAAKLHDIGKAHPVFQAAIEGSGRPQRNDLAKAPSWRRPPYSHLGAGDERALHRPGFRHELASTLVLFELLRQIAPQHDALLGPHQALLGEETAKFAPLVRSQGERGQLAAQLSGLSANDFNLAAYLICAHHGKVRAGWRASPDDQEVGVRFSQNSVPLRGVSEGDEVQSILLDSASGESTAPVLLHLDLAEIGLSRRYGASWRERVASLLRLCGPHALAWLETLIRVADVRASSECNEDDVVLSAARTA